MLSADDRLNAIKINQAFPPPTDCFQVNSLMPALNEGLAYAVGKAASGPIFEKIAAGLAVKVYNARITEYSSYITSNCGMGSGSSAPPVSGVFPPQSGPIADPTLDSALVPPGSSGSGGTTSSSSSSSTLTGSGNSGATTTPVKKQLIKGVPNWALYAGGALLLIGGVVLVVKKSQ